MTKLYVQGTVSELQALRIALDHANGYFDDQGNRLPPGDGTTVDPPTLTQDGTVGFLWLPMDPDFVVPHLGEMHNGVMIPASGQLLTQEQLAPEFQAYLEAWAIFSGPKPAFPETPPVWPPPAPDPQTTCP